MKPLLTALATLLAAFAGWQLGQPASERAEVSAPEVTSTPLPPAQPTPPAEDRAASLSAELKRIVKECGDDETKRGVRLYGAAEDFAPEDFKPTIVALLADQSSWNNRSAARLLTGLWAERDLPSAREWVLGMKNGDSDFSRQVFDTWARSDLSALCAWTEEHANELGERIDDPAASIAKAAGRTDPERGLRVLAAIDPEAKQDHLRWNLFHAWALSDPAAAAARATDEPHEKTRERAIQSVALQWGARDPTAARAWAETLSERQAADNALLGIAHGIQLCAALRRAADFLASIPQTNQARGRLGSLVDDWAKQDFAAAFAWAAEQSDAGLGDWALARFTKTSSAEAVERAIAALPETRRAQAAQRWQAAREKGATK